MPNTIGNSGLQIQTRDEIIAELLNGASGFPGYLAIYGPDINVDPNSADGQLLNLFAQGKIDVLELLAQIYNSFDPDQAVGRSLDQRCAINGVVRKAGTYTYQSVDVTATQAVTINGVAEDPINPFTVSDAAGNRFVLLNAYSFLAAGTQTLSFRAEKLGSIATTPNTINRLVTILLGISAVNNPTGATSIGNDEESDYALRVRRAQSVSLPSKGYLQGLIGALYAIDSVTAVLVLENYTSAVDANGIPGHSIWCIVAGGNDGEVANAIYAKRNAGCGMKGSVDVVVPQIDGSTLLVHFDRPTVEQLWITFNLTAITGVADAAFVRTQILSTLKYGIGEGADASAIVKLIKELAPNCYVSAEGVSNFNGGYTAFRATSAINNQWEILSARIIINGTPGP